MRTVRCIHPVADVVPLARFDLHDLESMRLLLRGNSVVDWVRLHFRSIEQIDAFLRVNELDPVADRARLRRLEQKSIEYLEQQLKYRVPDAIRGAEDVRQLFQHASQNEGRRANRLYACMTLKVMHIIHHLEGYELLFMLPISEAELQTLLQGKIERTVRGLLERNFPIVEFEGSRKSSYSVLSKLLAKKETQSAQVFDRLRFRFVVERREDIPPLLLALTRELLPFNYLIPGQAQNLLVDVDRMLVRAGNMIATRGPDDAGMLNEQPVTELDPPKNEFSGPDYRVVNFVADVPLRVDRFVNLQDPRVRDLGPVVFGAVEFQVVDRITAEKNESGENRHAMYKARQRSQVKQRLERGRHPVKKVKEEAAVERTGDLPVRRSIPVPMPDRSSHAPPHPSLAPHPAHRSSAPPPSPEPETQEGGSP